MADNEIPHVPLLDIETATVHEMAKCINSVIAILEMHTKTLAMAAKAIQKSAQLLEDHDKVLHTLVQEGETGESENGGHTIQ